MSPVTPDECGRAIADLLGSIGEILPNDAVKMLHWLATHHPDPKKEIWDKETTNDKPKYGRDILNHGINTTRGSAAVAIGALISTDAGYLSTFRTTLQSLVCDNSLAVRSCAAKALLATSVHDKPLALELFQQLVDTDERLLATAYVQHFICHHIHGHWAALESCVRRMLHSVEPEVREGGARLACLAAFDNECAGKLAEEAAAGDDAQRLGVARIASANIGIASCRTWCEAQLRALFGDSCEEVRREAALCFANLRGEPLADYEELFRGFIASPAFADGAFWILEVLEESTCRVPGVTCEVCAQFIERFGDEARDIRTRYAGDVGTVSKLLLRTYHQHQDDEWGGHCLDLIDRMCLGAIPNITRSLNEIER